MLVIDLPLFLASTLLDFEFLSGGAEGDCIRKHGDGTFVYMPFVMADGDWDFRAQCDRGDRGDMRQESGICAHAEAQAFKGKTKNVVSKKYRNRSGWLPFAEIGTWFLFHADDYLCGDQSQLRDDSVFAAFCVGLPLYRLHVAGTIVVRKVPVPFAACYALRSCRSTACGDWVFYFLTEASSKKVHAVANRNPG